MEVGEGAVRAGECSSFRSGELNNTQNVVFPHLTATLLSDSYVHSFAYWPPCASSASASSVNERKKRRERRSDLVNANHLADVLVLILGWIDRLADVVCHLLTEFVVKH
jgi:hypothetical protein